VKITKMERRYPYVLSRFNEKKNQINRIPYATVDLMLLLDDFPISFGTFIFETGLGPRGDRSNCLSDKNTWDKANLVIDKLIEKCNPVSKEVSKDKLFHMIFDESGDVYYSEKIVDNLTEMSSPNETVGFLVTEDQMMKIDLASHLGSKIIEHNEHRKYKNGNEETSDSME